MDEVKMKKIAIVGSREYKNIDKVIDFVKNLPKDTILISGGARGVDKIAENTARSIGIIYCTVPANWDIHGRYKAGFIRNSGIVDLCDELYAFWDEKSPGTKDSIDKAKKVGKLKKIFTNNETV